MPDEPATKQDLQDLEARLQTAIAESGDHLKEFSRDLQTGVLRAIYRDVGRAILPAAGLPAGWTR